MTQKAQKDRFESENLSYHSIFFRLLLIFGLSGIILVSGLGLLHRTLSGITGPFDAIQRYSSHYAELLVKELGTPPNHALAEKIANDQHLAIKVVGPSGSPFGLGESSDSFQTTQFRDFFQKPNHGNAQDHTVTTASGAQITYLHQGRHWVIELKQAGYQFLFSPELPNFDNRSEFWFLASIWVLFILATTYFLVRRLLKPVSLLVDGVNRMGAGDLAYRIDTCRPKGEFRLMANAFNTMAEKIQTIIQSKQQLLLDVSHEYRSPLTRLKVALELLPSSATLSGMKDDISDLEMMTTEILESAQLDSSGSSLKKTNFNAGEFARSIQENFKNYPIQWRLSLENEIENSVTLYADEMRLKIAIKNLVENALKYSPHDSIVVSFSASFSRPLVISVKDYGEGIAAAELNKIFDPFYRIDLARTKKERGGYGLGLSLVKKIVDAHQGKIEVHSEVGKGSEFIIELPTS